MKGQEGPREVYLGRPLGQLGLLGVKPGCSVQPEAGAPSQPTLSSQDRTCVRPSCLSLPSAGPGQSTSNTHAQSVAWTTPTPALPSASWSLGPGLPLPSLQRLSAPFSLIVLSLGLGPAPQSQAEPAEASQLENGVSVWSSGKPGYPPGM